MNVSITKQGYTWERQPSIGYRRVTETEVKIRIGGVIQDSRVIEIAESLWLRLRELQATKNWEATRYMYSNGSTPKTLKIGLGRSIGSWYADNYLEVWREGNRRVCRFVYGGATVGKFYWSLTGEPVGKIPRKPSKKHPKQPKHPQVEDAQ